jgi:malto-oligosyltrehalose trehalohydrolase
VSQHLQNVKHTSSSLPFGSSLLPGGGVLFRLWAPSAKQVDLCLMTESRPPETIAMDKRPGGWFSCRSPKAAPGHLYQFRVDQDLMVPDPASRYQPQDVHGPSMICDPHAFFWEDNSWHGRPWEEAVIYELHVGTFSKQGTFAGVRKRLDYLVDLGITAIELMPVCQYPGKYGWGYDGVLLFAPSNCYGRPEDLKELVQAAHEKGLMVFLDVVYNHFGPEGNYLYVYAKEAFFTPEFHTPWGDAINFSGLGSRPVRDFYIANALYWLEEFHFDGLRFDAVHAIFDLSEPDILQEIAQKVHDGPGRFKHIHLMLENDHNDARYLCRNANGRPQYFTAQWNDDLHHACHTLLTGENTGYYMDYSDSPIRHLGRCLTEGFAYQGEASRYRNGKQRGQPSRFLPPLAFVNFLQNHDQIGNRAFGERLITLCAQRDYLVVVSLLLLAPSPVLLFMGEEFGADSPFYFFCNFSEELAENVAEGRRKEFAGFPQFTTPESREKIPDPNAPQTFQASKIFWDSAAKRESKIFFNHCKGLLNVRHQQIVPRLKGIKGDQAAFSIFSEKSLTAWWRLADGATLFVAFNLQDQDMLIPAEITGRLSHLFYHYPQDEEFSRTAGIVPPKSIAWFLTDKESALG